MKKSEMSFTVGKPHGSIDVHNRGTAIEYQTGTYIFYHGTVRIYQEAEIAIFDFAFNGRMHILHIRKKSLLTDRQLMVRAGKFGRSIVSRYTETT